MKSKTITPALIVIFFLSFTTVIFGQNKSNTNQEALNLLLITHLINENINDKPNKPYLGEMTLKNGDVIEGYFSLNNPIGENYVVIHFMENNSKIYPVDTIEEVLLYKTDETNFDTVFKSVKQKKALLREVYNKNNEVAIYDTAIRPFNNKLSGEVYIKEKEELKATWFFWTSGPKHDLLRHIRNKDGIRYKRKDFESLEDLFKKV